MLSEKIRDEIDSFNSRKLVSDPSRVYENEVFGMQTGQIIIDSLSIQIIFWKQIEQLHLIKCNLDILVFNLTEMINIKAIAPVDQICFVEELLRQRQHRFDILQKDALELRDLLNSKLLSQMKEYIDQVADYLSKNITSK